MTKAHYSLQKAIKQAKFQYSQNLESDFKSNNTRSVWNRLKSVTNDKQKLSSATTSVQKATPGRLNDFYSRFDKNNNTVNNNNPANNNRKQATNQRSLPPSFTIKESDVLSLLR